MRACLLLLVASGAALAQQGSESVFFDEELEVTDLLKRGDDAARKGDWAGAVEAWQQIVEQHSAAVIPAEDGLWFPAATVCRRRVAALPAEGIAVYQARYATVAAQIASAGDTESLRRTAIRYFCTPAGGDAMERLGKMYADGGAWEMAVRCWEEVAERHPEKTPRPEMLARLGLLYARLGEGERIKTLLAVHGSLEVQARGRRLPLSELLADCRSLEIPARGPVSVNADLSLTSLPETAPVPRSVKWRLPLLNRQDAAKKPRQPWGGDRALELQTYPLLRDGILYVNLGKALLALDAETGAMRWGSPGAPPPQKGEKIPNIPESYFKNMDASFWLHRFYAVEADGIVYANQWETGHRSRLNAFRASNGKKVWGEDGGKPGNFDLTGPPLVWRNRIYVGAIEKDKDNDTWLLAFDRATGTVLWSRFLASYEPSGNMWGGNQPHPAFAPVVTAGGSYLYVCSNNGALACIGHSGELVWATKYPKTAQSQAWWVNQQQDETWELSPVIPMGGDILFFASDGTHCCRLDGRTGRGWKGGSDPLKAMQVVARERCRHLVALDGDVATLIGKECKLYDVKNPRIMPGTYAEVPENMQYCGRGLVTKDAVYVPLRMQKSQLWIYDRKFSRNIRKYPWPSTEPPGILLLSGRTLLSVSPVDIVAFSEDPPKEERGAGRRMIVAPEKKGKIAVYRCPCTGKEWRQPAEEEKLCLEFCQGLMPECGEFVREEDAPPVENR